MISACSVFTHLHLKCAAGNALGKWPAAFAFKSHTFVLGFVSKSYHFCLVCSWLDHSVLSQSNAPSSRPFYHLQLMAMRTACTAECGSQHGLGSPSAWCCHLLQETQEIGHCCINSPSSCCMAQADLNQKVFVHRQAVINMLATMIPCIVCWESSCRALLHLLLVDDDVCSTCLYIPLLVNI